MHVLCIARKSLSMDEFWLRNYFLKLTEHSAAIDDLIKIKQIDSTFKKSTVDLLNWTIEILFEKMLCRRHSDPICIKLLIALLTIIYGWVGRLLTEKSWKFVCFLSLSCSETSKWTLELVGNTRTNKNSLNVSECWVIKRNVTWIYHR